MVRVMIMVIRNTENEGLEVFRAAQQKECDAIDRFFAKINFQTKEESIRPENVIKARQAFYELCDDLGFQALRVTFDELLDELGPKTRKDRATPGWYHQFRQCLYDLSAYRSGLYTLENLSTHGGLEVSLIAKLRHDSLEDYGKTPVAIYGPMEGRLHELSDRGEINEDGLLIARKQIAAAVEIVDLMSRKRPYFDGREEITLEKHDGDPNEFLRNQYKYFFAFMGKLSDSVENISTRIIKENYLNPQIEEQSKPSSIRKRLSALFSALGLKKLENIFGEAAQSKKGFSIEKNMAYVREKRGQYGRFAAYKEAINKWHTPENQLETPIRDLDAALGVCIVINEVVNDHYVPGSKHNSSNAFPIRIVQYEGAGRMFEHIPKAFNPINLLVEELEEIAKAEMAQGKYKMAALLEKSIYPSLIELGLLPTSKEGSMVTFAPGPKGDIVVPNEVWEEEQDSVRPEQEAP